MLRRNINYDALAKETAVSFQYEGFEAVTGVEPERALNIGMGVASAPLWAAFYASAGLGAAWWWSTAWTRGLPTFDVKQLLAPEPRPAAEAYIEALDEAVCDLIETRQDEAAEVVEITQAVEESIELVAETTVENVSYAVEQVEEAVAEALTVEPLAAEPVVETVEEVVASVEEAVVAPAVAAVEELVAEPVVAAPAAEPKSFKPSKKKAPKTEG